jgi:16S rRNA (cytosine967-C5)-methyltransferase
LPAGLAARNFAVRSIETVIRDGRPIPRSDGRDASGLEPRDRAFAHHIAMTVLRHHGTLSAVLSRFIANPLPVEAGRAQTILLAGAAQLLLLGTPVHAAVDLSVEQCRRDRRAQRFAKLANAVLRRVAREGAEIMSGLDRAALDVPTWLMRRWVAHYGDVVAHRIAQASLREAPLDLAVKADPAGWATRVGGTVLATGGVRVAEHGRVEDLAGYADGAWWVQDAAAALPAHLLGNVAGLRVADLCAAPGGKTAALAVAGAHVTAVDRSRERLAIVQRNLERLALTEKVDLIAADIESWTPPEAFDAVLLDAPCTATGTIRRHPDILHLKRAEDIARLADLQAQLLVRASLAVKPGGLLVYCTCSLEPEEGAAQIDRFLAAHPEFTRQRLEAQDVFGRAAWITPSGDLATLPCFEPGTDDGAGVGGMDGFFASRLRRRVVA